MTSALRSSPILVTGVVLGTVVAAADLAGGESMPRAAIAFAIVVGYALVVTILARRSETFSVLAGRPVDERWEHINLQATAVALGISGVVALLAFLVAEVSRLDSLPFAFMGAVIGLSYIGSVAWLRLRQ